jgi:hypothetical protein
MTTQRDEHEGDYAERMAEKTDALMSEPLPESSTDVGLGGATSERRPNQPGRYDVLTDDASRLPVGRGEVDRAAIDRAEERIDMSAGGGLNSAAVQAAGVTRVAAEAEDSPPGTADVGAAAGADLGAGLGGTRGIAGQQRPRGEQTGAGGTRGSGSGTGNTDSAAAP